MLSNGGMKIAVDGATGYLGSHLVTKLKGHDLDILSLVHSGAKQADRQYLEQIGSNVKEIDLSLTANNDNPLNGIDVIVHLIGSIAPKKGETLSHLHGEQTKNLIKLAKAAQVKKIVMVTALGTNEKAESVYHRTKWQAEEYIKKSGLPYVILRPSLIVGKTHGRRNSKLVSRYIHFINSRSVIPLIGGGEKKIQPVFIDDLVEALFLAITKNDFDGQILEIGGIEIVSLRGFVEKLMQVMAKEKKLVAVPLFLAKKMAQLSEIIQTQPTVSVDQVIMANSDNVCQENALVSKFALKPHSLLEALQTYKNPNLNN